MLQSVKLTFNWGSPIGRSVSLRWDELWPGHVLWSYWRWAFNGDAQKSVSWFLYTPEFLISFRIQERKGEQIITSTRCRHLGHAPRHQSFCWSSLNSLFWRVSSSKSSSGGPTTTNETHQIILKMGWRQGVGRGILVALLYELTLFVGFRLVVVDQNKTHSIRAIKFFIQPRIVTRSTFVLSSTPGQYLIIVPRSRF